MSDQILGLCLKTYRWKIFFKLEIRVSKNLALLGGGGAHKGWEDRRKMK